MFMSIGHVHQFICHCPIPLDPCDVARVCYYIVLVQINFKGNLKIRCPIINWNYYINNNKFCKIIGVLIKSLQLFGLFPYFSYLFDLLIIINCIEEMQLISTSTNFQYGFKTD